MGQSRGGGYTKKSTTTPQQQAFLNQILQQAAPASQQAAAGYGQFLPGGGGGQAIIDQAMQRYQQQTLPSIMNAYGSGAKGSSALNQALAASASNLNTDLAAQLAGMQLQAAQGLGNMGLGLGNLGTQSQFAYMPRQQPFWQSALLGGLPAAGQIGGAYLGRPMNNFNFGG